MPKVFFCYRRDDSAHQAGRIYEHLCAHFGKDELFKDVNCMPLGLDFRRVLSDKVAQCDVVLALIGDIWLTALEPTGMRRIDNPCDFVRIEIESALKRNIPVIPVLVGKQPVPAAADLPEALRELAFRHGLAVRPDPDFVRDIEALVRGINETVGARTIRPMPAAALTAKATAASVKGGLAATLGTHSRNYLLERVLRTANQEGRSASAPIPIPVPPERTIRVGILKSGNATYVNEIERAFLANAASRLAHHRVRMVASHDCVEWGEQANWPAAVSRLMTRGGRDGFRFLVAIGTQAAVALHNSLGQDFGEIPALLLGITYPRIAGLVDSEHFRCETRQVACVRYGCGLDAVASLLHHRIFPGRRLCYVYQAGIPQDEIAAAELATTRLVRDGILRLARLERRLEPHDLADTETVYFSWYTFTRLFHEKEFSILLERLAVSIMQDNVRDGAAAVGVGTDHDWIGQRGAELIAERESAPDNAKPDWGATEVIFSPLVYWLNRTLAHKHGIEFSQAALQGAREVYD